MSDRIRQLEDALAVAQSALMGASGDSHPLLHRDLLKIKSSIELHSASIGGEDSIREEDEDEPDGEQYIDAFGTLAIRDDGAATFYGRSAGSESLLIVSAVLLSFELGGFTEKRELRERYPRIHHHHPMTRQHHQRIMNHPHLNIIPFHTATSLGQVHLPLSLVPKASVNKTTIQRPQMRLYLLQYHRWHPHSLSHHLSHLLYTPLGHLFPTRTSPSHFAC